MNVDMAMTYLDFVAERHRVYEARRAGKPGPWTDDQILRSFKFTNVFRILDHGSQFLVKELLWDEPHEPGDVLMRAFLYRYTNRPEPWLAFREEFGRYPVRTDLERNLPDLWREYRAGGNPVFGNAFKMFSGAENKGTDRLTWITDLTHRFFGYGPDDITEMYFAAQSPEQKLAVLKTIPRCADFMAMQIATDFGYWWPGWDENAVCLPGPGARQGAREIFPGIKPAGMQEALSWARTAVLQGDYVPTLAGRPPSLMDIQNTLCEFSKYARYMRTPFRQKEFQPAHPGAHPTPFLPPHYRTAQTAATA